MDGAGSGNSLSAGLRDLSGREMWTNVGRPRVEKFV